LSRVFGAKQKRPKIRPKNFLIPAKTRLSNFKNNARGRGGGLKDY